MQHGTYEHPSERVLRYLALLREMAYLKGLQEGLSTSVLEVLDSRGFEVDAEARQRIVGCMDFAQFKRWLRMVVTVQSVQELFEPSPASKPPARKVSRPARSKPARKLASKR